MTDDQKRALSIGGVGLGGLLLWRHFHSTSSSLTGGTATPNTAGLTSGASGSIAPFVPQSPITVAPGESVYDPNTEGLYNTPTATSAGQPVPIPAQVTTPAAPGYTVNVNYPKPASTKKKTVKPTKRKIVKKPKAIIHKSKPKPKVKAK